MRHDIITKRIPSMIFFYCDKKFMTELMKRLVRDGVVYMQPVYQACKIQCAHPREFVNKIYCMDLLAGLCASEPPALFCIYFLAVF